jgi:AcrR family transcriptional regulator
MDHLVTLDPAVPTSYAARRAAMADETRVRILDACTAILARGITELSIPAVAREAGVSVPTVYRNFADKKTLVAATMEHLRSKRGPFPSPTHVTELPDVIRKQFAQASSLDETVRAALVSEPVVAARHDAGEGARRRGVMEKLLADDLRGLPPHERDMAVSAAIVLCSSLTLNAFRLIHGSTPEQAAEAVTWTLSRMLGRDLAAPPPTRKTKGSKR